MFLCFSKLFFKIFQNFSKTFQNFSKFFKLQFRGSPNSVFQQWILQGVGRRWVTVCGLCVCVLQPACLSCGVRLPCGVRVCTCACACLFCVVCLSCGVSFCLVPSGGPFGWALVVQWGGCCVLEASWCVSKHVQALHTKKDEKLRLFWCPGT